jgi:hypothetical protein
MYFCGPSENSSGKLKFLVPIFPFFFFSLSCPSTFFPSISTHTPLKTTKNHKKLFPFFSTLVSNPPCVVGPPDFLCSCVIVVGIKISLFSLKIPHEKVKRRKTFFNNKKKAEALKKTYTINRHILPRRSLLSLSFSSPPLTFGHAPF